MTLFEIVLTTSGQVYINDNFAKFSESLFIADRHARDEVRERALMQQKLAEKEKAQKEENLRLLAQRAREERAGIPAVARSTDSKPTAERVAAMQSSLGAYGSESEDEPGATRGPNIGRVCVCPYLRNRRPSRPVSEHMEW